MVFRTVEGNVSVLALMCQVTVLVCSFHKALLAGPKERKAGPLLHRASSTRPKGACSDYKELLVVLIINLSLH